MFVVGCKVKHKKIQDYLILKIIFVNENENFK